MPLGYVNENLAVFDFLFTKMPRQKLRWFGITNQKEKNMWQSAEFRDYVSKLEEEYKSIPKKKKPQKEKTKTQKLVKGKIDYLSYINSGKWRNKSKRIRKKRGACEHCGSIHRLQVHHLTYERLGNELPSDLLVLCRDCHLVIHDIPDDSLSLEFRKIIG